MVLGRLVGVAIASKVISKTVKDTAGVIAANKRPAQNNTYVNNFNNYNTYQYNTTIDNSVQNHTAYQPNNAFANCDYCGGMIELRSGVTSCPYCGAPIRLNQQTFQPRENSRASNFCSNNQFEQRRNYSFPCYRCGAIVCYTRFDVVRNPASNHAVMAAGFSGHTGEVQCTKCGTFLPHYESSLDANW